MWTVSILCGIAQITARDGSVRLLHTKFETPQVLTNIIGDCGYLVASLPSAEPEAEPESDSDSGSSLDAMMESPTVNCQRLPSKVRCDHLGLGMHAAR